LRVEANRTATIDLRLEIGSETVAVQVNTEADGLAVRDGPLRGGNFLPRAIIQLPLIGLDLISLARTLPGVIQPSVEVSAESLYEAVALAICALRQDDWSPPPGLRLRVAVRQPVVEHTVEMRRFEAWLNGAARSPRERVLKERLKQVMGGA
jgi:hypothetical protein